MTALLSARNAAEVRAFAGAREPAAPAMHPLEAVCAALRLELDEARAAIVEAGHERERAVEAAREAGLRDGLAQAERSETARLAVLEEALKDAVDIVDQRLIGLDCLAAELAHVALTRLLDEPDAVRALSASFIAQQVRAMKGSRLVRARVSADDFEDEASLAALGARLRGSGLEVEIVPYAALQSGQARLDFALGCAELDLARQWQSLATLLRSMAQE
ncbi:hypothetical protein [Sphingomonas koreensis]